MRNKNRSQILNLAQFGFSILELLIGLSILSIISVLIVSTLHGVQIGGGQVDGRAQLSQSLQLLQRVLMNVQVCTDSIDKTSPVTLDFAVPLKFDVAFELTGFGKIKTGEENTVLNLFIDEVYVDGPIYSELSPTGRKIFVGILKVTATQRINRNGVGERGILYKNRTVGAISISFADTKDIVDCQMSPRGT